MNGAVGPDENMSQTSERQPRRTEFNRFQTFSPGPFVPTCMDAHFDPYQEGLPRPGLSRRQMEAVERIPLPALAAANRG
ncbi:MAG: hypothetical protein ACRD2H_00075 [Terriglobales bacterium]